MTKIYSVEITDYNGRKSYQEIEAATMAQASTQIFMGNVAKLVIEEKQDSVAEVTNLKYEIEFLKAKIKNLQDQRGEE